MKFNGMIALEKKLVRSGFYVVVQTAKPFKETKGFMSRTQINSIQFEI